MRCFLFSNLVAIPQEVLNTKPKIIQTKISTYWQEEIMATIPARFLREVEAKALQVRQ